jgi:hypothetical protein
MKPEAVGVDERRLAALTLHALAEHDRQWILAQVTPAQREELRSLLSELKSLGIPSDRSLVEAALVPAVQNEVPMQAGSALCVPPQRMAQWLRGEPVAIVARCLSLLDAGARDEVLRLLPEDLRASVEATPALAPAPALAAALASIVSERLGRESRESRQETGL